MNDELMKINSNGVLTIPAKFRKAGFEPNQYVNVTLENDGTLRVIPVEAIPKSQLGFHQKKWLEKEKKASRDLKEGKAKTYQSKKEFLKALSKW